MIGSAILATWFPEAASTHAPDVDGPFYWIYILAVLALFLIAGLALTFMRVYKRQDPDAKGARGGSPNPVLLGLWVLAALGLAVFAFVAGFPGFIDQTVAPYGSYGIDVTARQWDWDFTYPNGHVADTLHVAADRPVSLTLKSEDVEHGLAIPAVRLNSVARPGFEGHSWFEATEPGTYDLRGSLFNGDSLTAMNSALVVHSQADFDAWLESVSDIFQGRTLVEVGELLYNRQGCAVCHTTNGAPLVGPTFQNLYGYEFDTVEGVRVTADDAYIKESILTPNASVVAGYQPVMTPYAGILDDREIEAITAWLRSLSDRGGTPEEAAAPADTTAVEQEEN